jgi:hypothetical protein
VTPVIGVRGIGITIVAGERARWTVYRGVDRIGEVRKTPTGRWIAYSRWTADGVESGELVGIGMLRAGGYLSRGLALGQVVQRAQLVGKAPGPPPGWEATR